MEVTETEEHEAGVTQPPSPQTKKVVGEAVSGTLNSPEVFEVIGVPPQLPEYKCQAVALLSEPVT